MKGVWLHAQSGALRGVWKWRGPKQWVQQAFKMPPLSASLCGCTYPCLHDQQDSNDSRLTSSVRGTDHSLLCSTLRTAAPSSLCSLTFPPRRRQQVLTVKQDIPVYISVIKQIQRLSRNTIFNELLSLSLMFLPPFLSSVGPALHTLEATWENSTAAKDFAYAILLWITSSF